MTRPRTNIGRRSSRSERNYRYQASQSDAHLAREFTNNLQKFGYTACRWCAQKTLTQQRDGPLTCLKCSKDALKFSAVNNMLPSSVPDAVKGLSVVEQMLIARVNVVMRVVQLRACRGQGQLRYRGNIINIEQDVQEIATQLPHTPSSLSILLVRRQGASGYADFRVRRSKVLNALIWLRSNNKWYQHIIIDQAVINTLPQDGDITAQLQSRDESGLDEEQFDDDDVTENALPRIMNERQQAQVEHLLWPQASPTPINEFRTEGFIPMAFPHLFPDGSCDFNDFSRLKTVTLREWAEQMIRHKDDRFAQDPRFRFYLLNMIQRHDACKQGAVFAKRSDIHGNVEQLRSEAWHNPAILQKLMFWSSKVRGSNPYWYQRQQELLALVNRLGAPTLFITLSSADLWWPCLTKHYGIPIEQLNSMSESEIAKLMQKKLSQNPLIADEYFDLRVKEFLRILNKKIKITDFWYR